MPQAVTVYRWDDPGAPQLTGRTPAEIIDVLTKCLVDGYGAKSPLGWTRPFYNAATHAAAFRNSVAAGGSGGYFKCYSSNGGNGGGQLMIAQTSVSMSDIDTPFRPGYSRSFYAQSGGAWVLIGTATGFYFFISNPATSMSLNNNYACTFFAGDMVSLIPNDAGRFILAMGPIRAGDWTSTPDYRDTLDAMSSNAPAYAASTVLVYDSDGFNAAGGYQFWAPGMPTYAGSDANFNTAPSNLKLLLPVVISLGSVNAIPEAILYQSVDRDGVIASHSNNRPLMRGYLPGLFGSTTYGWRLQSWPQITTISGHEYWILRTSSFGPTNRMINMEQWDAPNINP
ncbi:MAG: hypothetical protein KKE94_08090 [Gammaproteobacteria bacterium]|nr:hypothetical protein [Gammaproteobacteria bacterium]